MNINNQYFVAETEPHDGKAKTRISVADFYNPSLEI